MNLLLAILPKLKPLLYALIIFVPLVVAGPTPTVPPPHTPTLTPARTCLPSTPYPHVSPSPTSPYQPFSVHVFVRSGYKNQSVREPFASVALSFSDDPDPFFYRGYTTDTGTLSLGLWARLPQTVSVHVWRDEPDGVLDRFLPHVVSDPVLMLPRRALSCSASYDWDLDSFCVNCYSMPHGAPSVVKTAVSP